MPPSGDEDAVRMRQAKPDTDGWLDVTRTALLVIDMQRGFLEQGAALEVPEGRKIIANVKTLIDKCRAQSVPVVYTRFVYSSTVPCLRGEPFGIEHLPVLRCDTNARVHVWGLYQPLYHRSHLDGLGSCAKNRENFH